MVKKILSVLLCTALFIPAAAHAAVPGVGDVISSEIIKAGEITTMTVSPRLKSITVAATEDKTVLYGLAHNSGGLYAFDVTDNRTAVQLGNKLDVAAFDNKEAEMYVKDGYLIFANGNNVQINELNDDGSVGAQKKSFATGGTVASLKLADHLLFAGSENKNNGVTVYDVTDPADAVQIGTIPAENSVRSVAVEKRDDNLYRTYLAVKASVDGVGTVRLAVTDTVYDSGVLSIETVMEESLPVNYSEFGWQGFGGYTATDSAGITVVKPGYVSVESNNSGRFLVDLTDPAAPVVIGAETVANAAFRYRKLTLDSTKVIEINKNSAGVSIMDYTDPGAPAQIDSIKSLRGEGACIFNNYLYTTTDGQIHRVKLYDAYTVQKPIVEKTGDSITVSVDVDNHVPQNTTMTLLAAIYKDKKMIGVEFLSEAVLADEEVHTFTVNLDVSDQSDYTFKAWMFDNFKDMTLLSDVVF